ncbi:MAG: hypothetical protein QF464_04045, partial [Myxococcota bacterium]|nr:hypothetical protein [Myxococcota bacterium]
MKRIASLSSFRMVAAVAAIVCFTGCAASDGLDVGQDGVPSTGPDTVADATASADGAVTDVAEVIPSGCLSNADCNGVSIETGPCGIVVCDTTTGECVVGPQKEYAPCDDGDKCTEDSTCRAGECVSVATVDCDDGNPCTTDSCVAEEGCRYENNTDACDDGNPCTTDDACAEAVCVGVPAECPCEETADCAAYDDIDPCNGTLACDAGQCVVDAASVVTCDTSNDGPCRQTACDPATGACETSAVDAGACSDGDPCTIDDACLGGACVGQPVACECDTDADCAVFDDGDLCNGTKICVTGVCELDPGTAIACPAANSACMTVTCEPATGACGEVPAADGGTCDDGDLCTVDDACQAGGCVGSALDCDDDDLCTTDTCAVVPSADGTGETAECNHEPVPDCDGCGDGVCAPDDGETCESCPADCGDCPVEPCGDGECSEANGENCTTCPVDCGECPDPCGDGECNAESGETCETCPVDCGDCPVDPCGDTVCDADGGETCESCPVDCGDCPVDPCGDTVCDADGG